MPAGGLEGRRLGGFELVERLGAGGFATVWRARQLRLGRDVAVKVLDPALARNADAARRFEREGRAAASLDHPSIVPVYEAGEDDGAVFLAMRLVDGATLARLLAERGALDAARLLDVVEAVASALDHAHGRGLVHRDVKPSNILIEDDRVWLADFGIAALAADIGRYTSGALGTAAYMAPEQARPGDLDHRADLYALACVIYECVTGRVPFPADDLVQALMAHASDPVPSTGVPALDRFFSQALAKQPADRFQSGAELVGALRAVLPAIAAAAGAPPTEAVTLDAAAPGQQHTDLVATGHLPVPSSRRPRRSRRRPLLLVAAAAGAVLVVAAAVAALPGDPEEAPPPAAAEALVDGGTVVAGWRGGELASANPHVDLDAEGLVAGNVLPPLYALDADGGWVPHLAEGEPEVIAADPLTLRWRLRPDAVWDDATPVTAADVERTYRYLRDPASQATATALYERIADLRVEDDRSFTITFTEPLGEPRVLFSTFHPVLKASSLDAWLATGGAPEDYLAAGIDYSGGPFRLVAFDVGEEARLVRNEAWWGEPAHLDRVVVRLADSGGAAVDAVASGELDVALVDLPQQDDLRRAGEIPDVEATLVPGTVQLGIQFNLAVEALADVRLRRAVLRALDRAAISEAVAAGGSSRLTSPPGSLVFFPGHDGYEDRLGSSRRDLDEARRLLDEAGWARSADGVRRRGEPLQLELVYPTGGYESARLTGLAILIVEQLSEVGIDVVARPVASSELVAAWTSGDFTLSLSLAVQSPDPLVAVARYSARRCPATVAGCDGRGLNYWSYRNEAVTDLLERSDATLDQAERLRLLVEADRLLALDLPAIPIAQPPALVVARRDLTGLEASTRAGALGRMSAWAYTTG